MSSGGHLFPPPGPSVCTTSHTCHSCGVNKDCVNCPPISDTCVCSLLQHVFVWAQGNRWAPSLELNSIAASHALPTGRVPWSLLLLNSQSCKALLKSCTDIGELGKDCLSSEWGPRLMVLCLSQEAIRAGMQAAGFQHKRELSHLSPGAHGRAIPTPTSPRSPVEFGLQRSIVDYQATISQWCERNVFAVTSAYISQYQLSMLCNK